MPIKRKQGVSSTDDEEEIICFNLNDQDKMLSNNKDAAGDTESDCSDEKIGLLLEVELTKSLAHLLENESGIVDIKRTLCCNSSDLKNVIEDIKGEQFEETDRNSHLKNNEKTYHECIKKDDFKSKSKDHAVDDYLSTINETSNQNFVVYTSKNNELKENVVRMLTKRMKNRNKKTDNDHTTYTENKFNENTKKSTKKVQNETINSNFIHHPKTSDSGFSVMSDQKTKNDTYTNATINTSYRTRYSEQEDHKLSTETRTVYKDNGCNYTSFGSSRITQSITEDRSTASLNRHEIYDDNMNNGRKNEIKHLKYLIQLLEKTLSMKDQETYHNSVFDSQLQENPAYNLHGSRDTLAASSQAAKLYRYVKRLCRTHLSQSKSYVQFPNCTRKPQNNECLTETCDCDTCITIKLVSEAMKRPYGSWTSIRSSETQIQDVFPKTSEYSTTKKIFHGVVNERPKSPHPREQLFHQTLINRGRISAGQSLVTEQRTPNEQRNPNDQNIATQSNVIPEEETSQDRNYQNFCVFGDICTRLKVVEEKLEQYTPSKHVLHTEGTISTSNEIGIQCSSKFLLYDKKDKKTIKTPEDEDKNRNTNLDSKSSNHILVKAKRIKEGLLNKLEDYELPSEKKVRNSTDIKNVQFLEADKMYNTRHDKAKLDEIINLESITADMKSKRKLEIVHHITEEKKHPKKSNNDVHKKESLRIYPSLKQSQEIEEGQYVLQKGGVDEAKIEKAKSERYDEAQLKIIDWPTDFKGCIWLWDGEKISPGFDLKENIDILINDKIQNLKEGMQNFLEEKIRELKIKINYMITSKPPKIDNHNETREYIKKQNKIKNDSDESTESNNTNIEHHHDHYHTRNKVSKPSNYHHRCAFSSQTRLDILPILTQPYEVSTPKNKTKKGKQETKEINASFNPAIRGTETMSNQNMAVKKTISSKLAKLFSSKKSKNYEERSVIAQNECQEKDNITSTSTFMVSSHKFDREKQKSFIPRFNKLTQKQKQGIDKNSTIDDIPTSGNTNQIVLNNFHTYQPISSKRNSKNKGMLKKKNTQVMNMMSIKKTPVYKIQQLQQVQFRNNYEEKPKTDENNSTDVSNKKDACEKSNEENTENEGDAKVSETNFKLLEKIYEAIVSYPELAYTSKVSSKKETPGVIYHEVEISMDELVKMIDSKNEKTTDVNVDSKTPVETFNNLKYKSSSTDLENDID